MDTAEREAILGAAPALKESEDESMESAIVFYALRSSFDRR